MVNTSIGTLFKVKSGDGIAVASLLSYGKYPVYGGNGVAGYTNQYNTESGTMIIGRVGEKCGNVNISASKCWVSDNALKVIPLVEYNQNYMMYLMEHMNLNSYANRNAQPVVSGQIIYAIEVPYCTDIEEQGAIASMLTNFDSHIADLSELIDKKKAIRDGALEDLLSGRTRLAGGTDRWTPVSLKDICSLITKGTTPLDKSGRGTINFIKVENIDQSSGEIQIEQKISEHEHTGYLKRSQLMENDILFSIAGTLGRVTVVEKKHLPANTNQALAIIRLKEGHRDYVRYYLVGPSIKAFIKENPTVGAQPNLSLKQVGILRVMLPSLGEQKAIAGVLAAMDNEITALENERDKVIQIREGAMNDLLTGRVRLSI